MNKQILIQHTDLIKEKEKIEKRIQRLEKQSDMISDVVQNGYKRHAVIRGFDITRSKKLNELKNILVERDAMITIQQIEIENYINTIEQSDIRQILEHRYIDNMNWYQIQTIMGYRHEDTARKKHNKFIEKNL